MRYLQGGECCSVCPDHFLPACCCFLSAGNKDVDVLQFASLRARVRARLCVCLSKLSPICSLFYECFTS